MQVNFITLRRCPQDGRRLCAGLVAKGAGRQRDPGATGLPDDRPLRSAQHPKSIVLFPQKSKGFPTTSPHKQNPVTRVVVDLAGSRPGSRERRLRKC